MKMGPQEDYIETVFTCEGDFDDPKLHDRLVEFRQSLNDLLHIDKKKQNVILKKVEPWNSVRVTFNIPRGAALRLKQLAQQGDETLRRLGVLAVQIEGDQLISLTIAGKNNERTELVFRTSGNFVDDAINSSVPTAVPAEHNHVVQASPERPPAQIHSPSSVDLAHKNIVDYLRQGAPMFLSQIAEKDGTVFSPSLSGLSAAKDALSSSTNPVSLHIPTAGQPETRTSPPSALSNFRPLGNPAAMSNSPILDNIQHRPNIKISPESLSPKYPSHLLPSSPLTQHGVGTHNFIFPPPPPYPHSSIAAAINNIQKLPKNVTSASPLLVNLLQTDPAMAMMNNALLSKIIPPLDEKPIKKKRKRKNKEGKNSSKDPTALRTSPDSSIVGIGPESVATTSVSSLPGHVGLPSPDIKAHGKFHHHMHLPSDHNAGLYASGAPTMSNPIYQEPTLGKLINPYTGDLEPADTVVAGNNLFKDSLGNASRGTSYLPKGHVGTSLHSTAGGLSHSHNSRRSQSQSTSPASTVAAPMRPKSNPGSAAAYLPLSVATTSQMGLPIRSQFPPSSSPSVCDTLSKGSLTGFYRMTTPQSAVGTPAHFVHHQHQPAIHTQPLQAMQHVAQNVGLSVMSLASHTNHNSSHSSSNHQQPHPLHHLHHQQLVQSSTPPASQRTSIADAARLSGGGNPLPGLSLVEDLLAVTGGQNSQSVTIPTSSPMLSHYHAGAMSASAFHENRTLIKNKDSAQASLLGRSEPVLWRTDSCSDSSHIVVPVQLPVRCASTKSNIQHGAAVCGHDSRVVPQAALDSKQELDKNSIQKHLRNQEPPNVLTASDRRLALPGKPSPPTSGGSLSDDVCSANHDSGVSSQSETASDTQFNEDTLSFSDAQPNSPSLPQASNKGLSSSLLSVNHPPTSLHSAQRSATACVLSAAPHQNNPYSINHTPILQRTKPCSADAADDNIASQHVQVTSTLNMHSAANNPQISIMQSNKGQLLNVSGDSHKLAVSSRSDVFNPVTLLHWNTKGKTSDFHTAKTTKVLSEDLLQRLVTSHASLPPQQVESCKMEHSNSGGDPSSRLSVDVPHLVEKRLSPLLATSSAFLSPVHDAQTVLSKSSPHSKRVSPHYTTAIMERHYKDAVSTQAGLGNDTHIHTHKQSGWHSPRHQYHSSSNPILASVTSTVISGGHPVMSSSYPAVSVNHMASSLNHIQASSHTIAGSLHPDLRGYHATEDKLEFGGTLHNSHGDSYQGGSTAVVGAVNQSHELMHHINHILKTKPLAKNILLDGLDKEKAFIDSLIDRKLEILSARSVSTVDSGNRHSVIPTSVHSTVASLVSHTPNNHNLAATFESSVSRSLTNVNFSDAERLGQNYSSVENIGASDLHPTDSLDLHSAKDNNGKVSDMDIKPLGNGSYDNKMDLSSLVVDKLVSSISASSSGKQLHQLMPVHSTPSGSPEQVSGKVGNITNMYMRKSPTSGLATLKALAPLFSSDLPLPKRLTESIQKLVKPLPSGEGSDTGDIQQAMRKPPSSKQIPLSSSPPNMTTTNHGHSSSSSSKSPVSDHCLLRVSSHPSLYSYSPQAMVSSPIDGHGNIRQQTHTGPHLPSEYIGNTSSSPSTTTATLVKSSLSRSPKVSSECVDYSKHSNRTDLIDGLIHSRTPPSAVNVSNDVGINTPSRLSPNPTADSVTSRSESQSETQLACDVKPVQSVLGAVCTADVVTDNVLCAAIIPQSEVQSDSNNIIVNKDAELLHNVVKPAEQHSEKLNRTDSGYIECLPDCSISRKEDDVCQSTDKSSSSEAGSMCIQEMNSGTSSVILPSICPLTSTDQQCHPTSSEPCQQHSYASSESSTLLEKQLLDNSSEIKGEYLNSEIKTEDLNSGYVVAVSRCEQSNSNSSVTVSSTPIQRLDTSNVYPESSSLHQADSKPLIQQHNTILNDTNTPEHVDNTESILATHDKITSNCDRHSLILNENTAEHSSVHMIATQDGSFIVSGRGPGRRPRVSKKILRSLDRSESPMETRTLRGGKTFNRDGALAIRAPKAAKRKATLEGVVTELSTIHTDEKATRVFRNRAKITEELPTTDLPNKRTRLDSTTSVSNLAISDGLPLDEDSKDTNCESVSDITVLSNESVLVNKAIDDTMPHSNDSSATLIGDTVLCTDTDTVNCFSMDNSVSTKPTIETLLDNDAIHKIEDNVRDKDADIANWKTLNFGFDLDIPADELDDEASMAQASIQNKQSGLSPTNIIHEERPPSHINKVISPEETGTADQQFKRTTRSGARPRSTELIEASTLPAATVTAAPIPPKRRRLSRDRPS